MKLITRSKGNTRLASVTYENTGDLPVETATARLWCKTDSTQDAEIEALIKETVDLAENEFNLTIIDKTVTATFAEYGEEVSLPFAPVKAITSVEVDGEAVDYELVGDSLLFDTWGNGVLVVTYTTGYTILPEGLKLAVKKAVLSAFEDRQDTVLGGVGMIPNHSRALFKKYRNY